MSLLARRDLIRFNDDRLLEMFDALAFLAKMEAGPSGKYFEISGMMMQKTPALINIMRIPESGNIRIQPVEARSDLEEFTRCMAEDRGRRNDTKIE